MDENDILKHVVVVTGCIGTGKSTVCRLLAERGAHVVDADELARRVVEPGRPELTRIREVFGPQMIRPDGSLDRTALGAQVFSNHEKRRELEAITHPGIRALALSELKRGIERGAPLVVYDCPLYFESGMDALPFRGVVVVSAPREISIARAVSRGLTRAAAEARLASQWPIERKRERATVVIENDGDTVALAAQVDRVFAMLRTRSA